MRNGYRHQILSFIQFATLPVGAIFIHNTLVRSAKNNQGLLFGLFSVGEENWLQIALLAVINIGCPATVV